MGCDCAPKVADLLLYWYEYSYISEAIDKPKFFFYIFVGFINLVPKKFWTKMMSARSKKPMIFCEG